MKINSKDARAISSCYGSISEIVLIYWNYLIEGETNQYRIRANALKFYNPLIYELCASNPSRKAFTVNIVIENDFDTNDFEKELIHELSSEEIRIPCTNNETHFWKKLEIYNKNIVISYESLPCCSILLNFLVVNLDFQRVGKEILAALDIKSSSFTLDDFSEMYNWIQDPFIPLSLEGMTILLEPFYSWPVPNGSLETFSVKYLSQVIASQSDILVRYSPYLLQGGNLLVGSDFAFIGEETIYKNLELYRGNANSPVNKFLGDKKKVRKENLQRNPPEYKKGEVGGGRISQHGEIYRSDQEKEVVGVSKSRGTDLIEKLGKILGLKKLWVVGEEFEKHDDACLPPCPKELFHLDLFLTLGGMTKDGKELVLLGQVYIWSKSEKEWKVAMKSNVKDGDRNQLVVDYLDSLDNWIKGLEEPGANTKKFTVVRLPLLYSSGLYHSYNNCLIEFFEEQDGQDCGVQASKRIAYIPKFGLEDEFCGLEKDSCDFPDFSKADSMVVCKLTHFGFTPKLIDFHFRIFAESRSGLHCLVSVLSRDSVPLNP